MSESLKEKESTLFHELSHLESHTHDGEGGFNNLDYYFDTAHHLNYFYEGSWKKKLYGYYVTKEEYYQRFVDGTICCPKGLW